MPIPITRTKLIVPSPKSEVLVRERLIRDLMDHAHRKLILVHAQAGYGKSTLLIEFANRIERRVCWFKVDALDREPKRFLAHLIASIAEQFPGFGRQVTAAIEDTADIHLDFESLSTHLANEVLDHIHEPFLLILDDFHAISEDHGILHFVDQLLQKLPANAHLVMATRTLPRLNTLPTLVASNEVAGVGYEDLAFRPEEIRALVLQNAQMHISRVMAEELATETNGWITGLLLSMSEPWVDIVDRLRLARLAGVGLYEYLAQQVLDDQPPQLRDFLLRTAVFDEFDVAACAAVLGPDEAWDSYIRMLFERNLFVNRVGEGGRWVEYHQLFRDFLRERLSRERPAENQRLTRALANWYAQNHAWERAFERLRSVDDPESLADVVLQARETLVAQGRLQTLSHWISYLPQEVVVRQPALTSLQGIVGVMLGETERGLRQLNCAVSQLRAAQDTADLPRILVWRTFAHRFRGDYDASLGDAQEALTIIDGHDDLRGVQADALRARGQSLVHKGQLEQAVESLSQSLAVYQEMEDEKNIALTEVDLGFAFNNMGQMQRALTYYRSALAYWKERRNVVHQGTILSNIGVAYHALGELIEAGEALDDALQLARQSGYKRQEALSLASLGDLYADLEAFESAIKAYHLAREIATDIGFSFLSLYLDLAESEMTLARGETERTAHLLESARRLAETSQSHHEQGLYRLVLGRFHLALGDVPTAIEHFTEALQRFTKGGQRLEATRAHLYLLASHHAIEDRSRVHYHLEQAVSQAVETDARHHLITCGCRLQPALQSLKGDPQAGAWVTNLLRDIARFERQRPSIRRRLRSRMVSLPLSGPDFVVQAFSRAMVTLSGHAVTWDTRDARDMFFCLVAHEAQGGLTKEELWDRLWPDVVDASKLPKKFKNTIYRLRGSLPRDAVIYEGSRYRLNPILDYRYDVEDFRSLLTRARGLERRPERIQALREALDQYTGPFLPELGQPWVTVERESLFTQFVAALLELGDLYLEIQALDEALACSQKVIGEDPLHEPGYRLAMRAYAAKGDRGGVARTYKRCLQALQEAFGIDPSDETQRLSHRLLH